MVHVYDGGVGLNYRRDENYDGSYSNTSMTQQKAKGWVSAFDLTITRTERGQRGLHIIVQSAFWNA